MTVLKSFEDMARRLSAGEREALCRSFGKKAMSLVELEAAGVAVPQGWCLGAETFSAFLTSAGLEGVWEELASAPSEVLPSRLEAVRSRVNKAPLPDGLVEALERNLDGEKFWAVRSSGSKEDMGESSFAGLYESVLNVRTPEAVLAAVRTCWASVFSERVFTYCRKNHIDISEMAMGVIIQEMVPAERSGVLFTVNPISGRDTEMLIEACFGVGEALVGGEVTPDLYLFDWNQGKERQRTIQEKRCARLVLPGGGTELRMLSESERGAEVLSSREVASLAEAGLLVQRHFGFPVDVEWAECSGRFFFVQARPVTRVNTAFTDIQWTSADFKDGGVSSAVCSRMMWSLYDLVWESAMPAYLKEVHLMRVGHGTLWGDMFYGRPYWNATAVKRCAASVPGFVERHFDEDLGVQVGYEGNGIETKLTPASLVRGLRVLAALRASFWRRLRRNEELHRQLRARLDELDSLRPEDWSDEKLFGFFPRLVFEDFRRTETAYFTHIFDNSNLQTLMKDELRPVFDRVNYLNLVVGIEGISHLAPIFDLWDVSRTIRADKEAARWWNQTPVETIVEALRAGRREHHLDAVRSYVEKHKHHSTRELDITIPNYGEDPSFILSNLKHEITCGDEHDPRRMNRKQKQTFEEEARRLRDALPSWRRAMVARRLEQMRKFLWWREELRDNSTRMYNELRRFALEVGRRLVADGTLDSREDVFHLSVEDVAACLSGRISRKETRARMERNKIYYECFRNYQPPPDLNFQVAPVVEGEHSDFLRGIPCSPGVVTAVVRVVHDIAETSLVEAGEILVTRFTDPGWTPIFGRIAGVVTETGGVLSHAAVIAREYGIPAVLAVPGATRELRSGQSVTIDGQSGRVILR